MSETSSDPKYNIVCLSNQLWNFNLWTNKKHVMTRLAKMGHNVLFVDPPINTGRLFYKQLKKKEWNLKRLLSQTYVEDTVTVYSPLNCLPKENYTSDQHSKRINKIAKKIFDPKRKTILWIYHVEIPGLENYLKNIDHDLLVYDCVDNYAGFPKYDTQEKKDTINAKEKYLATRANLVFATAPGLVEKLKKFNQNVFYTPNVGDYEKFKNVKELKKNLPQDLESIPRPRIGFTGAVDEYKFDKELFKKIASDYPGYSFVIIGSLALKDKEATLAGLGLADYKNVYFLGSRNYEIIQNYFAGFDVYTIPYQLNDYTVGGCFPVKFHDALAAGLPVVVTDLPAYAPFDNVCYISKSYNEFSQNIRKALELDNDEKVRERQKVAKENNWDGKVQKMLSLINTELENLKVSSRG